MVRLIGGILLFTALSFAAPAEKRALTAQQVLSPQAKKDPTPPRKLQGRFLHITDTHPDPHYKPHSATDGAHACHSGNGSAGILGAETTDCDSPITLVNATFQWINENLKDKVDFVIWTGDSARHDNDEEIPRSDQEVVDLNTFMVDKFVEVFGKDDNLDDPDPTNDFVVPIVPTFGNNDILPHNIFLPGPNKWTRKYASIWNRFIPEEQRHSFARGGWFFTEVIPNKLAVFSLNTLYFFGSNSAVDGCEAKSEPGYEHMEWLRIQLQFLRDRGMKAILTGHVPPARTATKQNWDETCWQKYTLWMQQYRDVVVGSIYGHMNIDHFMFQDSHKLTYDLKGQALDVEMHQRDLIDEHLSIQSSADYLTALRQDWSTLPSPPSAPSNSMLDEVQTLEDISDKNSKRSGKDKKKKKPGKSKKKKPGKDKKKDKFFKDIGGPYAERFSLTLVAPSVVPNYFPTLRVVEYNITGLEDMTSLNNAQHKPLLTLPEPLLGESSSSSEYLDFVEPTEADDSEPLRDLTKKKKGSKKKPKKPKRPGFKVPKAPSKTAPPGPAYSPQTFTFLSYTQYFANLSYLNNDIEESFFLPEGPLQENSTAQSTRVSHPKTFGFQVEYDTRVDSVFQMDDLTVRSYLDLAVRIGREELGKGECSEDDGVDREDHVLCSDQAAEEVTPERWRVGNNVWRMFVKRAFVMTKGDGELEDRFGC